MMENDCGSEREATLDGELSGGLCELHDEESEHSRAERMSRAKVLRQARRSALLDCDELGGGESAEVRSSGWGLLARAEFQPYCLGDLGD